MSLSTKFILILLSVVTSVVTLFTYINLTEDENTFNIQLENRINFMKNKMLKNAKYTMTYHKNEIENNLASMNLSYISYLFKELVGREEIEGASLDLNSGSVNNKMQLFEGRPQHNSVERETITINKNTIVIASPIVLSKYRGYFFFSVFT